MLSVLDSPHTMNLDCSMIHVIQNSDFKVMLPNSDLNLAKFKKIQFCSQDPEMPQRKQLSSYKGSEESQDSKVTMLGHGLESYGHLCTSCMSPPRCSPVLSILYMWLISLLDPQVTSNYPKCL